MFLFVSFKKQTFGCSSLPSGFELALRLFDEFELLRGGVELLLLLLKLLLFCCIGCCCGIGEGVACGLGGATGRPGTIGWAGLAGATDILFGGAFGDEEGSEFC